jgi:hypothetical protein
MATFSYNPTKLNENESKQYSVIGGEAGSISMGQHVVKDPYGSFISEDRSHMILSDKFGSLIQFIGGKVVFKTASDLCMFTNQNMFMSVTGDVQSSIGGSKHDFVEGDVTAQAGNDKQRAAAEKLQGLTSQIDKEKLDTIKSTEGQEMDCPVCSQKHLSERGSALVGKIFKTLRKFLPNMAYPLDVVQKIINFLVVPFLNASTTNLSLTGGKGCGSPGCKNGRVKSPATAIQEGNSKAADAYESRKLQIASAQTEMGKGGAKVVREGGDVVWQIGLAKNDAPTVTLKDPVPTALYLQNAKTPGEYFALGAKGTTKQAIHSDPLINPGSLLLDVANKFEVSAGSPGVDLKTSGKASFSGAVTNVVANQGELTLTSSNKTTLKGKNILIDAKDRSGDTGVKIESDNTFINGKLSVSGDLALKGSLMMDGGLYVTHLTCPSERIQTSPSGGAHYVHSNATWNDFSPSKATKLDIFDKLFKKATRDVYNVLTSNILSFAEIQTLIEETYSSIMIELPLDNTGLPTGIGLTGWYPYGTEPLMVIVPGVMSGTSAAVGYVIPGQITPVFNFTHNHNSPGQNHSHDTTVPAFNGYTGSAAARAARPDPTHVPTPAPARGMGESPGHKTMGDISSCGGGGGAFAGSGGGGSASPSRVDTSLGRRNQKYNINTNDAFNNQNYVDITPQTGNYSFNPDGSLNPPPDFNGLGNC